MSIDFSLCDFTNSWLVLETIKLVRWYFILLLLISAGSGLLHRTQPSETGVIMTYSTSAGKET